MDRLSIIIPAYNEAKTIEMTLTRVAEERVSGYEKEVSVVDDGSTDDTKEKIKNFLPF